MQLGRHALAFTVGLSLAVSHGAFAQNAEGVFGGTSAAPLGAVSRPVSPGGAPDSMPIPPLDSAGVRQTVNSGLSAPQTVWNLRSALNVAALNCLKPEHAPILAAYKVLLTRHVAELATANNEVTRQFAAAAKGGNPAKLREAYMTRVYNYFAGPSTTPEFCDAALLVSADLDAVPVGGLQTFAQSELPRIEQVFVTFFGKLESYRMAAAEWDRTYRPSTTPQLATVATPGPAPVQVAVVEPQPTLASSGGVSAPAATVVLAATAPTAAAPLPATAPAVAPAIVLSVPAATPSVTTPTADPLAAVPAPEAEAPAAAGQPLLPPAIVASAATR